MEEALTLYGTPTGERVFPAEFETHHELAWAVEFGLKKKDIIRKEMVAGETWAVLSDLHLGKNLEPQKFLEIVRVALTHDQIILNGDIWDGLNCDFDTFEDTWNTPTLGEILRLDIDYPGAVATINEIRNIAKQIEKERGEDIYELTLFEFLRDSFFLFGNHDQENHFRQRGNQTAFESFSTTSGKVLILSDGKKEIVVTHGDLFNPAPHQRFNIPGRVARTINRTIATRIENTDTMQARLPDNNQALAWWEEFKRIYGLSEDTILISGHTHDGENLGESYYHNSGCFDRNGTRGYTVISQDGIHFNDKWNFIPVESPHNEYQVKARMKQALLALATIPPAI